MMMRRAKREARARFDELCREFQSYADKGPDGGIELLNEVEPLLRYLSKEQNRKADIMVEGCKWIALKAVFAH